MQTIVVDDDSSPRNINHPDLRGKAFTNWEPLHFRALCPHAEHHLTGGSGGWGRESGAWSVRSQKLELHIVNGVEERAHEYCESCGHRTSHLPRHTWTTLIELGTGVGYRFIHDDRPCSITGCTNFGAELHHWAPIAVFGPTEAEMFPKSYLCRDHHQGWHRAMNGYQWNRKRIA